MARERVERRLAAILAADVAGYSRLIGADEEGTLARLKAHRRELIDPKITEHRGRIVKTTGDGFLVEFASVVDALRCATEVQAAIAERDGADNRTKLDEEAVTGRLDYPPAVHRDNRISRGSMLTQGLSRARFIEPH